jgi:integrase
MTLPKLNPNTPTLMDGEVRLFKRKHSSIWQVVFMMDGRQVRVSTKKRILKDAKDAAREIYLDYRFRQKNGLPVISKRFADVAALCRATMKEQLENGVGKKSFRDYIIVIDKYLVPFFGDLFVTSIDYEMLQRFARWREEKMGREPRASTLNTHNSALNRIFDEAVARGYMNKSQVPVLVNKGRDSVRRPDFTREEYATLIRKLPSWIDAGREGKSRDMRHLLRDYILILANTGMRHGTEAENLRWKHISLFEDKGLKYLEMSVSGKTGRRDIICRAGTINYLKRIQSRCPDIAHLSFEQLIKSKRDEPVFRLPDGTASANLRQTFRILMRDTGLLTCPRTGQDRTLYSLRHTYATFSLLNDGMDVHTLAVQMGTSILMIERHYSHLTPRLKKEMLTGKRYDTPYDEYKAERVQGFSISDEDLHSPVGDVIEESLPDELEEQPEEITTGVEPAPSADNQSSDKNTEASLKALDMLDKGLLTEKATLAVIGTHEESYTVAPNVRIKALELVEHGKLSERGLVAILGL